MDLLSSFYLFWRISNGHFPIEVYQSNCFFTHRFTIYVQRHRPMRSYTWWDTGQD